MRICFVGPANSAHIIKWCNWFSRHGHEVHVVSFTPGEIAGAQVHQVDVHVNPEGSDLEKLKYMLTGRQIKRIVNEIRPDVVNAHYATSYGIAMALSGMKGYVLSVWGSDIYEFPQKTPLHKALLKYSLRKAAVLFSTSKAMADEAAKYTARSFEITPFGVDLDLFSPEKRNRQSDEPFTAGTVKTLLDLYGIDYILKAAALIRKDHPEINLALRIAGSGPQEQKYKELADTLGIADITAFLGYISQEEAAREWANMDTAVIPSVSHESFGVAAVEAQASGTPVIVSDVGGLLETTVPGETSIVVPRKDEQAIAEALVKLYYDPELRNKMGRAGRQNAMGKYEINECFLKIEKLLETVGGRNS